MKFLYSLGGGNIPVIREYNINANTKFKKGQVVRISTSAEIAPDALGGCIGVAMEDHTGEKDILNERNNGTKLRVDITRDAVYSVNAPKLEATGGSATTLICNAAGLTGNLAVAKLVLVRKGENSTNTDSVGSERMVTGISISGGVATFELENGGVVCEGDVYALFPVYSFKGVVAENGEDFAFNSSGVSTSLYVINYNTDTVTLEVMLKKDFIA